MTAPALQTLFDRSWRRAWSGATGQPPDVLLRDHLLTCYCEPQRRYHTREHLAECLALFDHWQALASRPHEVELALWFHDGVYELGASDNEARSAAWAEAALLHAGVPDDTATRVRDLVLATRHESTPVDGDAGLLADLDLAIFAAPDTRFEAYEVQVRAEHASVPDALFWPRRKALLLSFLERPTLYATSALRQAWEAPARAQLRRAIDAIDAKAPGR